jgi:hypothetical protein
MKKQVSPVAAIAVIVIVVIIAVFLFVKKASPGKKRMIPGVGVMQEDGTIQGPGERGRRGGGGGRGGGEEETSGRGGRRG